jgi:hypothetical protein
VEDYAPYAEVKPDVLAAASRRVFRLRRHYWFSGHGGVLCFLSGFVVAIQEFVPRLNELLIPPLRWGFFLCIAGSAVLWFSLLRFRCPRCGERFILSTFSSWPGRDCKHCRLRLG